LNDINLSKVRKVLSILCDCILQIPTLLSQLATMEIYRGWKLLHIAALANHEEITRQLLNCEADINYQNLDGLTPLAIARKYGGVETEAILLKKIPHSLQLTPLHYLCPVSEKIMTTPLVLSDGYSLNETSINTFFTGTEAIGVSGNPLDNTV